MLASRTRSSRCLRGLLLLLAGSLLVACAGCLQGSTCYNDDGGIIEDDVPCNPDAEQSFCCGKYWTCLDSGVCSDQNTTQLIGSENTLLARATCTDRTFKSDVCPQFCLGDLGRGITLSETNTSFCCQQDLNLPCHADPIVKSLDLSNPLTTISFSSSSILASKTSTSAKITTSSSLETSSSARATPSASSTSNVISSRSRAAVTTSRAAKTSRFPTDLAVAASSTAQAPLAITPTTSPTSAPKATGLSEGAKIGVSVSITLVVVSAIAALLFFCYRRRERRKKAEGSSPELPASDPAANPARREKGYYAPDYNGIGNVPQELDDSRNTTGVVRGELPTESHNPRAEMSDPFGQELAGSQRRPLELA